MFSLAQVHFGAEDARNEILFDQNYEEEHFLRCFVNPADVDVDAFLNGRKFLITGLKGAGKSALLKYIELKARREIYSETRFFFFQSSFSPAQLTYFKSQIQNVRIQRAQIINDAGLSPDMLDFQPVWRWFIHNQIASCLSSPMQRIAKENGSLTAYLSLVSTINARVQQSPLWRFIPKLSEIQFSISNKPEISGTANFSSSEENCIGLDDLDRADLLLKTLEHDDRSVYLFIDELEIKFRNHQEFDRDCRLLGDLLIVLRNMNEICRKAGNFIHFICAIRTEITNEIGRIGLEINKIKTDFGVEITWHRPSHAYAIHPLIQIPMARILLADKKMYEYNQMNKAYPRYFPRYIKGKPSMKAILDMTWYRPRDMVNMFRVAQKIDGDRTEFRASTFAEIRQQYANVLWEDLVSGLTMKYTGGEISALETALRGFKYMFSFREFKDRLVEVADNFDDVALLLDEKRVAEIMCDLYQVGALGNKRGDFFRYSYRGNPGLVLDDYTLLLIHQSLSPRLSMRPPRAPRIDHPYMVQR